MNKPNTLWKVVSILYIVFEVIGGVVILIGLLGAGALFGAAAGSVGVGVGIAAVAAVFSLIGAALGIAAGIVGLKANVKAGKVFAIILIAFAAISFISNLAQGQNIVSSLIGLVLPVLYGVGVHKQVQENGSAE
ncbi:MAG: hypothetical protein Q4D94_14350 [Bacillota bacterium]|nr:hypothetical protein [Bacillota bacterium]